MNLNTQHSILNTRKPKGFTLIELIIVIAIIGILTALIIPNFMAGRICARDSAKKADMRNLKQALQMYYNDFQSYPEIVGVFTANDIPGCGVLGDTACGGNSFETNAVYMKQLPTVSYRYYDNNNSDTYVLRIELENASDEDLGKSQTLCNSSCPSTAVDCCIPSTENFYCVCPD